MAKRNGLSISDIGVAEVNEAFASVLDLGSWGLRRFCRHPTDGAGSGAGVLLPSVRAASEETLIAADGFSCRTQIASSTDRRALHLAEILRLTLSGAES